MRRRRFLAGTLAATLAGCGGSDTDDATPLSGEGTTPPPATATPTPRDATPTPTPGDTSPTPGRISSVTPPADTTAQTTTHARTPAWPAGPYADYETTRVRVESPESESRGTVIAAVAATDGQRYLGLSDARSLPEGGGMLFVYDAVADRTFVMRRMDFGLDIVYADAERRITSIHHAPAPGPDEDGSDQRYPGRGQYVLEVNLGWTTRNGIEVGDTLEFDR